MTAKAKRPGYEESVEKLEEIVEKLESGEYSIDESMDLFREGIRLTKYCNEMLNEYEKSITKLVEKDGEFVEEDLDG
jgi:exodeoxyribonuclease VII small subunit